MQHLGLNGALSILKWFEILPQNLNTEAFFNSEVPNPQITQGNVDEHMPWADVIARRINYKFRNRAFLLQVISMFG